MILDAQLMFCEAMALPNATTKGSTNVIDLAVAERSLQADDLKILFLWTGTPVGTSINIDVRSTAANTGVPTTDLANSPAVHWSSGVIPAADYPIMGFVSGQYTVIRLPLPTKQPNLIGGGAIDNVGPYKRYLGLFITSAGDTSAGLLTSCILREADIQHYPTSGYGIAAVTA